MSEYTLVGIEIAQGGRRFTFKGDSDVKEAHVTADANEWANFILGERYRKEFIRTAAEPAVVSQTPIITGVTPAAEGTGNLLARLSEAATQQQVGANQFYGGGEHKVNCTDGQYTEIKGQYPSQKETHLGDGVPLVAGVIGNVAEEVA
jgi:hypothetical protein